MRADPRPACQRIVGLPTLPLSTASGWCFGADDCVEWSKSVTARVAHVRASVHPALGGWNATWALTPSSAAIATPEEVQRRYAGIVVVGDSQIREVAWAVLQLLASEDSRLTPCMPNTVRTGWRASCTSAPRRACSWDAVKDTGAAGTEWRRRHAGVASPEFMPLVNVSHWDSRLTIWAERQGPKASMSVCDPSHFLMAYQPIWGNAPIDPTSLPACLHQGNGRYGRVTGDGTYLPILWVINGGGLHEIMGGHEPEDPLPQNTLRLFGTEALQHVVWVPTGAGPKGCSKCDASKMNHGASSVFARGQRKAKQEVAWTEAHGVRAIPYQYATVGDQRLSCHTHLMRGLFAQFARCAVPRSDARRSTLHVSRSAVPPTLLACGMGECPSIDTQVLCAALSRQLPTNDPACGTLGPAGRGRPRDEAL